VWFSRREPDESFAARLKKLEQRVDVIDLEWSDWFDRFRNLYAKLAKRVRTASEEADPAVRKPQDGRTPPGMVPVGSRINPLAEALLRGTHHDGGA